MSVPPDTRSSLIARLADVGDDDAWREFASLYEPFVYQQARRFGLQHADARELVQEVLIAVSKAIGRFSPDQQRGRFRTWLYAIGRNISLRQLARVRAGECVSGDPRVDLAIAKAPDPSSIGNHDLDVELKRHVFLWVAQRVRGEFKARTWKSFWRTAVENHSVQSTAEDLKMTVGAVYVARSRVMARIRASVQEITRDGMPQAAELLEHGESNETASAEERAV